MILGFLHHRFRFLLASDGIVKCLNDFLAKNERLNERLFGQLVFFILYGRKDYFFERITLGYAVVIVKELKVKFNFNIVFI